MCYYYKVNFSQITDDLFVGVTPAQDDCSLLHQLGVRLIINMRAEHRLRVDCSDPHLSILWLRTYDTPLWPISVATLRVGVHAALDTISAGGKVYAHCRAGAHRSVVMAASILIAQGTSAQEAMRLIKQRRAVADPDAWYIRWRINRFAATWERAK